MQYAAVVAALVATVVAEGWENIETTTTTPAPVYTTPAPTTTEAAPSWSEWEVVPSSSDWEAVSSIPVEYTTKKPAETTSWAVWSTSTAPAKTTSVVPTYTGAASKANMVGAGAMGLAAVAFML